MHTELSLPGGGAHAEVLQRASDAAHLVTLEMRHADDGVGIDDEQERHGLGLESMRKRAAAIGASLSVRAGTDSGCRVELRFFPRVGDRR